jgi:hypothetical protein
VSENLWIQIIVYAITILIASLRFGFLVGKLEASCVTKQELKDKVYERDEKIKGVYHALDTHRNDCKSEYVRKDMCSQMHSFEKEERERIDKVNMDSRHDLNNKMATLALKNDLLFEKIAELKGLVESLKK